MTTARTIIKRALQQNGVLTKGESPTGDEASDGLASLNDLIASWSNDSLLVYARMLESFPIVSGQQSYTIGIGGNFNTERPLQIVEAYLRLNTVDYQLSIINDVTFDGIILKDIQSAIPEALLYETSYPLGKISLFPIPTAGTLFLRTEKQLTQIASLDTELQFPPGWERALRYSLAIELAGEYGQPVNEALYMMATDALGKIKTATARNRNMDMYAYDGQMQNIYTGWYAW